MRPRLLPSAPAGAWTMFYAEKCLALFSCLCKSVVNLYNPAMQREVPERPTHPRWLKSLIVLLLGLVYLAAVYLVSPALREELRYTRLRYEVPFVPRIAHGDEHEVFDPRLVARGRRVKRLRATAVLTGPNEDDRTEATLLFDGPERVRIDLKEGTVRSTFIRRGGRWWQISVEPGKPRVGMVISDHEVFLGWYFPHSFASPTQVAVFLPYLWPDRFEEFLSGQHIRAVGEKTFQGRECRVLRVQTYRTTEAYDRQYLWPSSHTDLWIRNDTDILLKTELTRSWALFRMFADDFGAPKGADIVCVLTSFEEDVDFEEGVFDPLALVREFSGFAEEATSQPEESPAQEEGGAHRVIEVE